MVDPQGDGVTVLPGQDTAVSGQRIAAISPAGQAAPAAATAVIAGGGMVALPGLINTHAHAAMTLFRGAAEDVPVEK